MKKSSSDFQEPNSGAFNEIVADGNDFYRTFTRPNMHSKNYTIQRIADILKGDLLSNGNPSLQVEYLLLDSRKLLFPDTTLFFAVQGKRLDGHNYIPELYEKGVRNFIVSKKIDAKKYPEANLILVKSTIDALQKLASFHRKQFSFPVIGITGSNGKSIVKEWLYQLLHEDYSIVRSPKSYNSQIGVPLSVWLMDEIHDLAIFEAGLSEPGEIEKLEKIIQPTIGILTNIGEAHSESFLNIRHKTKEKLRLFAHSDILIYCKDAPDINQCIGEITAHFNTGDDEDTKFKTFTWSFNSDSEIRIRGLHKGEGYTIIIAKYDDQLIELEIPFTDDASIENAIHCFTMLVYLGLKIDVIAKRMKQLTPIAMRLELKEAINNCTLINDSYNSDMSSLKIAIDFLNQQKKQRNKTLILSDILQSGRNDLELYSEVADIVRESKINKVIAIGPNISKQEKIFETIEDLQFSKFPNTDTFLRDVDMEYFQDEIILLKGARKFTFEKIGQFLESKAHATVLEINLGAVEHNLKTFQSLLKPETKLMVMVKALSYGSGNEEIAKLMQYKRVDYLAVAYADEGVQLRKAGIESRIMVMNPEVRSFEAMIKYQLEPEVYNLSLLEKFLKVLRVMNAEENYERFPIHLKLETGMNRLGFENHDIPELLEKLMNTDLVKVNTVFSHLAAAERPAHDDFTNQQISQFIKMSDHIIKELNYPIDRHILNSAGIVRFPDAQFEMVRLGIGLYGIDISNLIQDKLQNISTLKATISQIKQVKAGETVGYGRAGRAEKDTIIGTISIGYADGLNRKLGNGVGSASVHGQLAPYFGTICMDMCMIDITNIPNVQEGDEVVILGKEVPINKVATQIETIPYEVLTSISSRVKRVYFNE